MSTEAFHLRVNITRTERCNYVHQEKWQPRKKIWKKVQELNLRIEAPFLFFNSNVFHSVKSRKFFGQFQWPTKSYLCANYFAKLSTNLFHDMNAIERHFEAPYSFLVLKQFSCTFCEIVSTKIVVLTKTCHEQYLNFSQNTKICYCEKYVSADSILKSSSWSLKGNIFFGSLSVIKMLLSCYLLILRNMQNLYPFRTNCRR